MGKKILACFLSLFIIMQIVPLSVFANENTIPEEDVEEGKENYAELIWNINEEGVLFIGGEGELPTRESQEGGVFPWDNQKDSISSVVFLEGITKISSSAFYDYTNLESITFSSSVQTIGEAAFWYCTGLKEVTIPDTVTSMERCAFSACENLEKVILSKSLTCLEESVFSFCTSLETIVIPDSVTEIKESAFYGCTMLYDITWSSNLKKIGQEAFLQCDSLEIVYLPEGFESAGNKAFNACKNLETIVFPDSTVAMGESLFDGCISLKEFTVPKNIKKIEKYTFANCNKLKTVMIPEGLTEIGSNAFLSCSALENITLPTTLEVLGDYSFSLCSGLNQMTIPEKITHIPFGIFNKCTGLTSVNFSEKLEKIDYDAFIYCSSLEKIQIPDSVKEIGSMAFMGCSALKEVSLPESLEILGSCVFEDCVLIENITIPENVKSIGSDALAGCTSLKKISLGNKIETLGQRVFEGCEKIESITIPEKITTLSIGLFQKCRALKNVILPDNLTEIGKNVFKYCDALESIVIPESVENIGMDAFYKCGITSSSDTQGVVLAVYPGSYAEEYAKAEGIDYMLVGTKRASVSVKNSEGEVITEGFTVHWYQGEELIATGTTLSGAKTGNIYSYEVILEESLAQIYKQPQRGDFSGASEDIELTCVLEKYPAATITGQVKGEEESVPEGVELTVVQHFGAYEKETAYTVDSEGKFSIEVLAVPTKMTISAPGFYSTEVSLTEEDLKEEKNVGVIVLKVLSENKIEVSLIKESAARPDETAYQKKLVSFDDISVVLKNKTQDKAIEDFSLQYPYIIINDKEVSTKDQIEILVSDPNKKWTAAPCSTSPGTEKSEIVLKENGKIEAVSVTGNTENIVMIFHKDGSFYTSYSVNGGFTSAPMPEGTYRLVWMKKTALLMRAENIEKLSSFGLVEGEDYVITTIDVKNGVISVVENISVPALDESKLYYTVDEETSFTATETEVVVGDYLMLRAAYDIPSKYKSADEELVIRIPENTEIFEGSVTVNGEKVPYTVENNMLRLKTEERVAVVRLYLIAKVAGFFCADAEISFTTKDTPVTQPIGSAVFKALDAKISVPETTMDEKITVTGTTFPNSTVRIYVDGTLKDTIPSNMKGTYTAEITLDNVYYCTYHDVYAEIENKNFEGTIQTETASVLYNANGVEIADVTMYHNGEAHVFDFINPGKKEHYVWTNKNFTFVIKFGGNTKTVEDVVLHVFDVQGNVHSVAPNYDSVKDLWMIACEFASNEAPVNVGVEYRINVSEDEKTYTATAHPMATENNKAFVSAWNEAYEDILTAEIKAENENSITLEMSFADNQEASFDVTVEEIAYESFDVSGMEANGFTKINADNTEEKPIYTKWIFEEGNLIYTLVDTELLYAYRYTTSLKDVLNTEGFEEKTLMNDENTDALSRAVWDVLENFPVGGVPEAAAITDFYQLIKFKDEKYMDAQDRMSDMAELITARCADTGKLRLTEEEAEAFFVRMEQMQITLDSIQNRFEGDLALYQNKISNSGVFNLLTLGVGKIVSSSGKTMQVLKNSKNAKYTKYIVRSAELREKINITAGGVWDVTTNLSQYIQGPIADFFSYFDVSGSSYWMDIKEAYSEFDMLCTMLENDIILSYDACGKENQKRDNDKKKSPVPDKTPVIDPSGYVYEAVPSNRVEGVKAEIYYYDYPLDENGEPKSKKENILWDAENYDQINPIYTDVNGRFRWDVPQGQWLVKFTKSGYTATDSSELDIAEDGYLPVPPPQTDVNVGMHAKAAPTVESVEAYKDAVIIGFSQYMDIDSVEKAVSVVYGSKEIDGEIRPMNSEYDGERKTKYASFFAFVSETTMKSPLIVTIEDKAENYAGKEMKNSYTVTTQVVNEPEDIEIDAKNNVPYNGGALIEVAVTPAKAGAKRVLSVESISPDIVEIITHEVTTDASGIATIMVEGKLPGTAEVKISLNGTLLTNTTEVTVLPVTDQENTCEKVTASIKSGTEVEEGTKVTLSTATKDATIYYTLDGTCPCDTENKSRKKYTKALTINSETLLIAYAVKEGMKDSPTTGFMYRVEEEYERVEKPTASPAGGKVESGTTVKLTTKTKNATIYYTTNGTTPTEDSKVYTSAIKVTKAMTIKAIAMKDGMRNSAVMSESYSIKPKEEKPVAGGGGGGAGGATGTQTQTPTQTTPTTPTTPQKPADTYVPTGNELYNFRDVTKDQWFYAPIKYAVDKKLFSGMSDTEFAPNNLITRAMMVTVLHRADNSPAAQYAITYYDVDLNGYYTPAVRWATAASIVKGYSVTEFGTNDNITREQIAAIMYRYAQYKGYDTSIAKSTDIKKYTDASEISDYAVEAMQYCVGSGLMKGKTPTTLNPKDNATRAEIAAILQRMIENNKAE